jgi:hypothetical protein
MTIVTKRTRRRAVTIMATNETFNQEQALKAWTELQRVISTGATSERKESVHNLENQAAKHGLLFIWRKDENRWILEPMSEKEKAIYKAVTEESE